MREERLVDKQPKQDTGIVGEEILSELCSTDDMDSTDKAGWHLRVLSVTPVASLVFLLAWMVALPIPGENKQELGMLLVGLIAICERVYGYNFGSSRKGNSEGQNGQ